MQDGTSSDPVAVAREVFRAFEAKEWARVAELAHPEALAEFKEQQVGMALHWEQTPELVGRGNAALVGFARVQSAAELDRLSPSEVLARWLEGTDPKPENYDDRGPPRWSRAPLGVVAEGASVAHLVYRIHVDVGRFGETDEIDVLTLKQTAAGWRFLLNRDLSMIGSVHVLPDPSQ